MTAIHHQVTKNSKVTKKISHGATEAQRAINAEPAEHAERPSRVARRRVAAARASERSETQTRRAHDPCVSGRSLTRTVGRLYRPTCDALVASRFWLKKP
jgi:hypothetical protein